MVGSTTGEIVSLAPEPVEGAVDGVVSTYFDKLSTGAQPPERVVSTGSTTGMVGSTTGGMGSKGWFRQAQPPGWWAQPPGGGVVSTGSTTGGRVVALAPEPVEGAVDGVVSTYFDMLSTGAQPPGKGLNHRGGVVLAMELVEGAFFPDEKTIPQSVRL